jgi:hypothetical protein
MSDIQVQTTVRDMLRLLDKVQNRRMSDIEDAAIAMGCKQMSGVLQVLPENTGISVPLGMYASFIKLADTANAGNN